MVNLTVKILLKSTFATIILFYSITSFAGEMTASELMESCKSKNFAFCDALIIGFTAGVITGSTLNMPFGRGLSSITLKNMFMKDMLEHSEAGNFGFASELGYVLIKNEKAKLRKNS